MKGEGPSAHVGDKCSWCRPAPSADTNQHQYAPWQAIAEAVPANRLTEAIRMS